MSAILIIDPDLRTAYRMRDILSRAGHSCQAVASINDGLDMLRQNSRTMAILNARLPWTDSFALLRTLEEKGWPVLFVTSDPGNIGHLHALYQGCCSVLLAPFEPEELCQRVTTLMTENARLLTLGSLRLDTERRQATLDGEQLTLTAQEFSLLHALMQSPDAAMSREELLRTAWGYQGMGETRTVDVHIQRMRRKLGASCIETVYKLGYRLKMA